jgi:hypothetical protein
MGENKAEQNNIALETILAICILFLPLAFINALAILLLLFLLVLFFSILLLAVVGLGQLIAGVTMVGIGIEKLFSMPMGAVAVMGFGVCNIGVALLLECFVLWWYGVVVPVLFKKITGREDIHEKKD